MLYSFEYFFLYIFYVNVWKKNWKCFMRAICGMHFKIKHFPQNYQLILLQQPLRRPTEFPSSHIYVYKTWVVVRANCKDMTTIAGHTRVHLTKQCPNNMIIQFNFQLHFLSLTLNIYKTKRQIQLIVCPADKHTNTLIQGNEILYI